MKISQLIELLGQYPNDMDVLVEGYENGYNPIHSLSIKNLAGVQNAEEYDGLFDTPNNLELPTPGNNLTGLRAMARRSGGERFDCVVITGLRGHLRPDHP